MSNLLDAFLKADMKVEKDVYIDRFDDHIRVKALLEDEFNSLREQATHTIGKGKNREEKVNQEELNGLIVAKGTVNMDFGNPQLLEKYKAIDAGDCARKALFVGEVIKLRDEILRLSGFTDNEEEVEQAKNS